MRLTHDDYIEMATKIEDGCRSIEYEKDDEVLFVECTLETDGYIEDDYENGTGAWVETDRYFRVDSVETYSTDGEKTENDFDESLLEKQVMNFC